MDHQQRSHLSDVWKAGPALMPSRLHGKPKYLVRNDNMAPENSIELETCHTPSQYHSPTTLTGIGIDTSMQATGSLHQCGDVNVGRTSLRPRPHHQYLLLPAPRATSTSFFSGISPRAVPVLVAPASRLVRLILLLCPEPRQPMPVPVVVSCSRNLSLTVACIGV